MPILKLGSLIWQHDLMVNFMMFSFQLHNNQEYTAKAALECFKQEPQEPEYVRIAQSKAKHLCL